MRDFRDHNKQCSVCQPGRKQHRILLSRHSLSRQAGAKSQPGGMISGSIDVIAVGDFDFPAPAADCPDVLHPAFNDLGWNRDEFSSLSLPLLGLQGSLQKEDAQFQVRKKNQKSKQGGFFYGGPISDPAGLISRKRTQEPLRSSASWGARS